MSVEAKFVGGVGYEIKCPDAPEDYNGHVHDYLCDISTSDIEYGYTGSDFSGKYTGYYAWLVNPFEDGLNVESKKKLLDEEISLKGFEIISDFGLNGGVLYW